MEISNLPTVEAIAYPREHTFAALHRAETTNDMALKEVYSQIHSRPDLLNSAKFLDIPVLETVENAYAKPLVSADSNIHLSIVATTRNDDHVERMQERTQSFIDGILFQAEQLRRNVELIIVEWNPPADRSMLREAYKFPDNHPFVTVVILTVPGALHQQYRYAKDLPLYQMVAKNAGIRRARGNNILVTNIDILFSRELFDFCTNDQVEAGKIFRADRWDVDRNVLDANGVEEMIESCPDKCIRINTRQGATTPNQLWPKWDRGRNKKELLFYTWFPDLHTEGCGDFQLMDRDSWLRVGGYCEVDAFSMHIDSLFALTCYHAGIEEVDMGSDLLHFHIDHSLGAEVKPAVYLTRSKTELRHPSMATLYNLHACMQRLEGAYAFNNVAWGLASTDLPVERVTVAAWDDQPLEFTSVDGPDGCRVEIQDLNFDDVISKFLTRWHDDAWEHCLQFVKAATKSRKIVLWGVGGRGRGTYHKLSVAGFAIAGVIHDPKFPVLGIDNDIALVPLDTISEDFFRENFVLVSSIFAEMVRGELEALGAVEGRDYIVTL